MATLSEGDDRFPLTTLGFRLQLKLATLLWSPEQIDSFIQRSANVGNMHDQALCCLEQGTSNDASTDSC